jgi:UDP-3-O-[3-hydroxymyristoyl] N-acetylglucosamine deacetylase/3-hydroxyacyl-[acyl-carrier-protein] dehydratase
MDGSSIEFVGDLEGCRYGRTKCIASISSKYKNHLFYREAARNVEIAALPLDDYRVTVMIGL